MSRCRVFKAYCAWHVYECGPKRYETFTTWAKAMEHAHREVQQSPPTLTVKDPSGAFCDLTAMVNDRDLIDLKSGGDRFTLARHEWEPLAKFLLAAAKGKEEV